MRCASRFSFEPALWRVFSCPQRPRVGLLRLVRCNSRRVHTLGVQAQKCPLGGGLGISSDFWQQGEVIQYFFCNGLL